MSDQLQFRVSAELKNILGRDLITSPDVAILELVKNSYDAHATKVEITFNDDYICIADNGKGMSLDDLITLLKAMEQRIGRIVVDSNAIMQEQKESVACLAIDWRNTLR